MATAKPVNPPLAEEKHLPDKGDCCEPRVVASPENDDGVPRGPRRTSPSDAPGAPRSRRHAPARARPHPPRRTARAPARARRAEVPSPVVGLRTPPRARDRHRGLLSKPACFGRGDLSDQEIPRSKLPLRFLRASLRGGWSSGRPGEEGQWRYPHPCARPKGASLKQPGSNRYRGRLV
jgi:hypothetical protein